MDDVADKPKRRTFKGIAPEARQRERYERFMEAGLELFGTRGYHGVTVRELCAGAKLTERYFYESFKDREALFGAVYQRQVELLRARVLQNLQRHMPDAQAMTRVGLETFFQGLREDPRCARILFVDVLSISPAMTEQSRQVTSGLSGFLLQFTQTLYPRVQASGLDPSIIATGLVGACINVAMHWVYGGFAEPVEAVRDNCYAIFEGMILTWTSPA
ncbi:TetR/AcrR family transcriptional regulator [Solimonas sp. K1W22B-7]|uniref:TetR/AcrR family transcriptional regulator n=1 Tax=Solimonas sp. K1W22B-7 TaxID=2303331 RepID=UPI000E3326D5|nr:TetR/AcrR family transcriptional regulator [Solimonas sp. K1W22B-7]AXQ30000.1 TetR/AcrR family transcriptional regulator [Solimonas sp. K1W22B-7]